MAKEPTISPLRRAADAQRGASRKPPTAVKAATAAASAAEEELIGSHDSIKGAYFAIRLSSDATEAVANRPETRWSR